MLFAVRCGACGRRGASPCAGCHAALRPPAPEPPPPGLSGLVAALRYDGPARRLVAGVKYRSERQAVDWLATALAERVAVEAPPIDAVTWVPTTDRHRRQRGFDQAELLARAVARRLRVPVRPLLVRVAGPAQTGRHARERRADGPRFRLARGGSAAPATAAPHRARATVLVVDDIVTTGATLGAAVAVLAGAGFRPVPAAAARTPSRRGALAQ